MLSGKTAIQEGKLLIPSLFKMRSFMHESLFFLVNFNNPVRSLITFKIEVVWKERTFYNIQEFHLNDGTSLHLS